jgi:acyl-CoA synthetase (AMP-forming)/AMP-acid ligase II
VHFAGEVFPIKHLRALIEAWPHPRYFNLYGPTETNVCTFHEVSKPISPERTEPLPIGKACSHCESKVVEFDAAGTAQEVPEGELLVSGASVMTGYWNLPQQMEKVFYREADGTLWYRTGDIVKADGNGDYLFVGRRDRMVKRRSYRVELGEIEAALYRHPHVAEAAVVALPDEETGVVIKAFVSFAQGDQPSLIEMKQFCANNLPAYMIPDRFSYQDILPKTSTDKTDYQKLQTM